MNYIEKITRRLGELLPEDDPALLRLYSLLVLITGPRTTRSDVHDAWAVWRADTSPGHPSLVPFGKLTPQMQELDEQYVQVIRQVARDIQEEHHATEQQLMSRGFGELS